MKPLVVLIVVAGSVLAHTQTAPLPAGQIKGTVTDQNGSPVSGATSMRSLRASPWTT